MDTAWRALRDAAGSPRLESPWSRYWAGESGPGTQALTG